MSSIGFTGTQRGCTERQLDKLEQTLVHLRQRGATTFHHGDCVGADEQAHAIAVRLGYVIVLHPPVNDNKRAFCAANFVEKPLEYMARNANIARACRILCATPGEMFEHVRSGTWSTVRRGRGFGCRIVLHFPNGGRFVERDGRYWRGAK